MLDEVREKIEYILNKLCENMYDKEEPIRLALLSSVAGENIFLLGPPGVAKSLIARKIKYAFKGARNFEYLMGRFSTPEEIFGPISISKLKNEDKYERLINGYLPDSEIVFLDEIWKASPAIQNMLLTAINEKIFKNGTKEIQIPMKLLIAASNELPAEGEGLEALWDRFIIRFYVDGIKDRESFDKMITDTTDLYDDNIPQEYKITEEEYGRWREKIKRVSVPLYILDIIDYIRKKIVIRNQKNSDKPPVYISDRRWKRIVNILRTSAYLDGREKVDTADCSLISYAIWNRYEEIEELRFLVEDVIAKYEYKYEYKRNVGTRNKEYDTKKLKKDKSKKDQKIRENVANHTKVHYNKIPKQYRLRVKIINPALSIISDRGRDEDFKIFFKLKRKIQHPDSGEMMNFILKEDFDSLMKGYKKRISLFGIKNDLDGVYAYEVDQFFAEKISETELMISSDDGGMELTDVLDELVKDISPKLANQLSGLANLLGYFVDDVSSEFDDGESPAWKEKVEIEYVIDYLS